MPIQHLEVPSYIKDTAMPHLKEVFSKIQAWQLFDSDPFWKCKRVGMMDADLLVKGNIDHLFHGVMPRAVHRGASDNCLFEARGLGSWYEQGNVQKYERGETRMKGGINMGLIMFEPSAAEFKKMEEYLWTSGWKPQTKMAEQELISHWFARDGRMNAMQCYYNFQLHQGALLLQL